MEEYQWNPNFENFEIFPQHINENLGLIYHGTSVVYSEDIEANGFRINHSPFSAEGLREIINLLADLGELSNFNPNDFQYNFNNAGAIDHYLTNPHPISFTTAGYPALKFASGDSKGGLIVGKIKKALDNIRELINELPNERKVELAERLEAIQNIGHQCNEISSSQGVIYVIRPSNEMMSNLYTDHKVIFSRDTIPAEQIIAKLIVDANYDLPQNYRTQSELIINRHFSTPQTIGFNLFKRKFDNDDDDDNQN